MRISHALSAAASTLAIGIAALPGAAYAQSTGSIETEDQPAIVVTGTRAKQGVQGYETPDSTKSRAVIGQALIEHAGAGQSILNTINLVPGVNFTNSDAYGSSGGNLRIRGFDGNRISLTFDGFPLNDSGNYAIYSNQQLDPELIEQVNVNLGTTDIDSPTASAAGGTVNYRTIVPSRDVSARLSATYGTYDYHRVFGLLQSGELTSGGLRGFISASYARNNKFKGPGEIYKQQYNAKLYQPLGNNGDFISIAAHYNQNRNAFYRNPSVTDLRTLFGSTTIPAAGSISPTTPLDLTNLTNSQENSLFGFENSATCTQPTPVNGTAQNYGSAAFTCTNYYGVRINPSNTGNVRFNSKFTLTDKLVFTLDASWQYVLANGGGYTTLAENSALAKGSLTAFPGVDFNHDGDFLDTVGFYTPNNTNTRRLTGMASLIWNPAEGHTLRLAYTYDRARHRQTGEWGYLDTTTGTPLDPFGGRNSGGVFAADGFKLQQRDRTSIALLNQIAGQYIGKFADGRIRVELGLRAPFFHRDLTNNCYTQTGGSGFATCTSQPASASLVIVPPTQVAPFPANSVYAPFHATYNFRRLLPNAGINFRVTDEFSISGNYAKGFSAPRTDNLYRAPKVTVDPETTDAFDLNLRYSNAKLQAQASGWLINFKNRIVTSFDPVAGISVDRNVGRVQGYGIDAGFAWQPVKLITLFGNASYNHSVLKDNILLGNSTSLPSVQIFAPTAGKRVTETPEWTYGGRVQLNLEPVTLGIQVKRVSKRFATDVNDVVSPAYTLVDLDERISLEPWGLKRTFVQFNVDNLFNQFYFGNISTQINAGNICPTGATCAANSANPNFSLGSPRTMRVTLNVGF